jgi:hypothetical protein
MSTPSASDVERVAAEVFTRGFALAPLPDGGLRIPPDAELTKIEDTFRRSDLRSSFTSLMIDSLRRHLP